MSQPLQLQEISEATSSPFLTGSSAIDLDGFPSLTLRFRLMGAEGESLDALRHARRALLREEWTRGRDPEEPSLEDAVFSPAEVVWIVRPDQRSWCLRKLEELLARANRALRETKSA